MAKYPCDTINNNGMTIGNTHLENYIGNCAVFLSKLPCDTCSGPAEFREVVNGQPWNWYLNVSLSVSLSIVALHRLSTPLAYCIYCLMKVKNVIKFQVLYT